MKINQLKAIISDAKIIDTSKLKTDSVQILSRVELKNVKNGTKMAYTIVSESEANLKEGKISVNTPIAQGLLGKKVATSPKSPSARENQSGNTQHFILGHRKPSRWAPACRAAFFVSAQMNTQYKP